MKHLSFFLALGLSVPTLCQACATVTYESGLPNNISITDESALIVWNAQTHTEHFVRQANFRTKAKDFGFLVPTPSKPQLGVAEKELFSDLERELLPRTKTIVQRGVHFTPLISAIQGAASSRGSADGAAGNRAANAAASSDENDVEVVEQRRVGDYNASVLRASDVRSLTKWLRKHRYAVSSDTRDWLTPYVKAGFFLTAFQIVSDVNQESAQAKAVRLTFKSDAPFFPYRETRRQQKQRGERTLRVFYIGDNRIQGRIENGRRTAAWPATVEYSAPINAHTMRDKGLSVPNKSLRLTAFLDEQSPRPGWGDLRFDSSSDQTEIAPAPFIVYKDKRWWFPLDVLLLGAFGLVLTSIFLHKKDSI